MTATLHDKLRERAGLGALPDVPEEPEPAEHDDAPQGEDDRYAIYVVFLTSRVHGIDRARLAETSRDGIGTTLCTLREEEQISNDSRVGILDRQERTWIVNPWARGS